MHSAIKMFSWRLSERIDSHLHLTTSRGIKVTLRMNDSHDSPLRYFQHLLSDVLELYCIACRGERVIRFEPQTERAYSNTRNRSAGPHVCIMLRKIWTVPKSSYWMLKMGEMAPTWDHLTHEQLIKCRDFFNTFRVSGGGMFRCDWTYDYLHGFFSTLILVLLTSDYKQWKNIWESLMCQQWLTWLTHERENSYSKKKQRIWKLLMSSVCTCG